MKRTDLLSKISKAITYLISDNASQSIQSDLSQNIPDEKGLLSNALRVTRQQGILTIALNRPDVLNAIDMNMAEALLQQLQVAATDETTRAIIITGTGRAFCAGGDLKFAVEANPDKPGDSFLALTTILHDCIKIIRTMAKPVIAAINGPAAGAGLFLALACDMRLMSHQAYLKQSNTSYGLSLPAGGTFSLPRLVGMGRALEMVLLDQPVSAENALAMGLVNKVIKARKLSAEAEALAQKAGQMPIHTIGRVKLLMNESFDRNLVAQLAAEQQAIVGSADSVEGREGLTAFLQKRKPEFVNLQV